MASNSGGFGGSGGGHYSLVLESHEVSVDTVNNQSLVEASLYISYGGGYSAFNNTGSASYSWSGTWGSGSAHFNYSFGSGGATQYLINNWQGWVGHDANGNASVSFSGSCNADNSPYLTTAGVGLSYGLSHINRYANITAFTLDAIWDEGFTIGVSTDVTCDVLQYNLDGAGFQTIYSGAFTHQQFTLHNLTSDADHTIQVAVHRQDNGLWTNSGTATEHTLPQNNFLPFM